MRVLLVVASLAALVAARPEAGYSYNVPSQRYGSPFNGIFADRPSYYNDNGFNFGKGFVSSLFGGESRLGVGGPRGFTDENFIGGGLGGHLLGRGNGRRILSLGGRGGGGRGFISLGRIGARARGGGGAGGNEGGTGGGVLRTTSVHAQVPPPDFEEEIKAQQVIAPRQARINYKIMSIMAPTAPTPVNPMILEFAQDQKMLIYVLVKKPEEADDIVTSTPTPTLLSKPENYFINYKTQKQVSSTVNNAGFSGSSSREILNKRGRRRFWW